MILLCNNTINLQLLLFNKTISHAIHTTWNFHGTAFTTRQWRRSAGNGGSAPGPPLTGGGAAERGHGARSCSQRRQRGRRAQARSPQAAAQRPVHASSAACPAPAVSREAARGRRGRHGGARRGSPSAAAAGTRGSPARPYRRPHRVLQLRRQRGRLPRRAGLRVKGWGTRGHSRWGLGDLRRASSGAVAGSLPAGTGAEEQPVVPGGDGGVHRPPRRAGGYGLPGEEGVPRREPRSPQHLPRQDRRKCPVPPARQSRSLGGVALRRSRGAQRPPSPSGVSACFS